MLIQLSEKLRFGAIFHKRFKVRELRNMSLSDVQIILLASLPEAVYMYFRPSSNNMLDIPHIWSNDSVKTVSAVASLSALGRMDSEDPLQIFV